MTISGAIKGYQTFARILAARAAVRMDAMLGTPRRIFIERSDFVLGAEAIPAPIAVRGASFRR
jgi:hypothetical protein